MISAHRKLPRLRPGFWVALAALISVFMALCLVVLVAVSLFLYAVVWRADSRIAMAGFRPVSLSAPVADIARLVRQPQWRALRVIRRFAIRPGRFMIVATAHRRIDVSLTGPRTGVAFYALHIPMGPAALLLPMPPRPSWRIYINRRDETIRYSPAVLTVMLQDMRHGLDLLRTREPVSRAVGKASWYQRVVRPAMLTNTVKSYKDPEGRQ